MAKVKQSHAYASIQSKSDGWPAPLTTSTSYQSGYST